MPCPRVTMAGDGMSPIGRMRPVGMLFDVMLVVMPLRMMPVVVMTGRRRRRAYVHVRVRINTRRGRRRADHWCSEVDIDRNTCLCT